MNPQINFSPQEVNEESVVALYRQVADGLRREILAGALPPGKRLPTIRGLAQELKISVGPVKVAYKVLLDEGLIVSSVLGTFVSSSTVITTARLRTLDMRIEGFTQSLFERGYKNEEIDDSFRRFLAKDRI